MAQGAIEPHYKLSSSNNLQKGTNKNHESQAELPFSPWDIKSGTFSLRTRYTNNYTATLDVQELHTSMYMNISS
jgi:hypothetical protein